MRILVVLMTFFLVPVCFAAPETGGTGTIPKETKQYIYEWTDTSGNVHITDDLGEVPKRYRNTIRTVEMPKGQEVGPQQQETGEYPAASSEAQDAAIKASWQKRLQAWKNRLADAQARYQRLDKKRQEALGQWGGPASGHLEGRAEAERIQQDMAGVQKEIDEAKDMIEKVIPEEARRAGIPPGWLRE